MRTPEQILSENTGEDGIYLTKGMVSGSDALDAMKEYGIQEFNRAIDLAIAKTKYDIDAQALIVYIDDLNNLKI